MNKKFEIIKKCDLCGYKKPEFFLMAEDRNYKTGNYQYVKCPECGLIWLSPRPNKKIILKYYPKTYKAHSVIRLPSPFKVKVRQFIYKHKIVARLLIKDQLFFWNKKGKILDVGTGNGEYLEILKGWGWESFGVELNKAVVRVVKKAGIKNIREGDLISANYPGNSFDVVRFAHVLEHVPSPLRQLKEAKRILKKNGCVIVLLPNVNSLFFKLFKSYWYLLDPPRHFFQYSEYTLMELLRTCGYSNIEIIYNQSPYPFIRSILYRLNFSQVEIRCGIIVYPLSLILRIINLLRMSDTIEVSARK